eukprot:TRINITY_DN65911_c0_g1_i1.p1 TRINITY_DN65911_c0_g1~~TRINITY_DN65911_c0_g1_i1.p1  ORF type:complete len:245 (-),score=28.79 TRINITY_DN65911_c0_g1_i1:139-873(-)
MAASSSTANEANCPICLCPLDTDVFKVLAPGACGHRLHLLCISHMAERSSYKHCCPVCRDPWPTPKVFSHVQNHEEEALGFGGDEVDATLVDGTLADTVPDHAADPVAPDELLVLCCRRVAPPGLGHDYADRRMEWIHSDQLYRCAVCELTMDMTTTHETINDILASKNMPTIDNLLKPSCKAHGFTERHLVLDVHENRLFWRCLLGRGSLVPEISELCEAAEVVTIFKKLRRMNAFSEPIVID